MNTSVKNKPVKATDLSFKNERMFVTLEDGRELSIPLEWFPRLRNASSEVLESWRFIGNGIGIHWEKLDEDLSIDGLLRGHPGK